MKAATYYKYGSPEVLKVEELPKPIPKASEVLIKVYAASVTSEDVTFRKAVPFVARLAMGMFKPKKHILGQEYAGIIEDVGESVKRFKIGDRVYGAIGLNSGSNAEYIALSETEALSHIPDNVSFDEAAASCGGFLTALPFLRDEGKIGEGKKILINGASGSVGSAAVQLAKHFGAEVTGVSSASNADLIESLGADFIIDYTREDFTQSENKYDIIFDAVGKSSFRKCRKSLNKNGKYLSTVLSFSILGNMILTSLFGNKKAKIIFTGLRSPEDKVNDIKFLSELLESREYKPVIDKIYSVEEVVQAHSYVEKGHKKGSVLLSFIK